jgi:hypothetical protein
MATGALSLRVKGTRPIIPQEELMRKFALATTAALALAFSAPAFTAPALAQADVRVKIKTDGDRSVVRKKTVIRHGGDVERRKVVIRHGDRGRHLGWRNRDAGNRTIVIKKRSGGDGMSRTVIKKRTVID